MSCALTDPYVPSISSVVDSVGKETTYFTINIITNSKVRKPRPDKSCGATDDNDDDDKL
jgi:hypothetical protein